MRSILLLPLRALLWILGKVFEMRREPVKPDYPYDARTNTITLPADIERELRLLIRNGGKVVAVKRVAELTGAGLRVSKDYVDGLLDTKP